MFRQKNPGLPANEYLDSLHAKPRKREEKQQQSTPWTAGFVGSALRAYAERREVLVREMNRLRRREED